MLVYFTATALISGVLAGLTAVRLQGSQAQYYTRAAKRLIAVGVLAAPFVWVRSWSGV